MIWSILDVPGVDSLKNNLSVPCIGKLLIRFTESTTTSVPYTAAWLIPSYIFNSWTNDCILTPPSPRLPPVPSCACSMIPFKL